MVYQCQVDRILSSEDFASGTEAVEVTADSEGPLLQTTVTDWPIYVCLTNGECYGVDFVISATGVDANLNLASCACPIATTSSTSSLKTAPADEGGGLVVNELMQCSRPEVYAAGDCAYAGWVPKAPHWFQMRLWSQARQTAFQAAKSMFYHNLGDEVPLDFSFEIFTHITHFFGYKVSQIMPVFFGLGMSLINGFPRATFAYSRQISHQSQ